MAEANSTEIDLEIVRLKREIGKEGYQGHSCDQCKDLKTPPLPSTVADLSTFFEIRTTATEIREDFAASGCEFWIMIQTQLEIIYSAIPKGRKLSHPLSIGWHNAGGEEDSGTGYTDRSPDHVEVSVQYCTVNDFADKPVVVSAEVKLFGRFAGSPSGRMVDFLPMALPGDVADTGRKCMSTPINLTPQTPNTMNLIKQWIKKCDVEHKCGISERPPAMPSLLLDLSDQGNVKLIRVPDTMRERYIALSYCWGAKSQSVMLKQQTKGRLISGVSQQELDPTIRDSIMVVRELGFRYLWVDALCIYQDNEEFKTAELGKMGEIYGNASFTIAASAAKGVQEGFLTRRVPYMGGAGPPAEGQRPHIFKVAVKRKEEEDTSAVLWEYNGEVTEPWYTRAWTLQEMLFSRRRLEYRANQTTWTCYCSETTVRDCDGWIGATPGAISGYSSDKGLYDNVMALLRSPGSRLPAWTILRYWYDLVDKYCQRALTYSTDRLPAISGIAKEFASVLEDEYVCGLWKSDLPSGLLWRAGDSIPGCPSDVKKQKPSWSWISYPGQVHWLWQFQLTELRQDEDFEILGYDLDFTAPNATFDGVTGARLKIRGLLESINLSRMSPIGDGRMETRFAGRHTVVFLDYKDDPRVQRGSKSKFAFLLIMNDADDAWGIMLAAEGNNEYTRVGRFVIGDWRSNSETDENEDKESRSEREECRVRWRNRWGGEENIRSIVLI